MCEMPEGGKCIAQRITKIKYEKGSDTQSQCKNPNPIIAFCHWYGQGSLTVIPVDHQIPLAMNIYSVTINQT